MLADREGLVAGIFAKRRLHVWTKIAKRSLWAEDLRFPEGRCFEDNYTIPWLLLRTRSHYHVPEPWVFYRIRPDSIVGLAARAKRGFDVQRNEDLAQGLAGYPAILRATLPNAKRRTLMLVSRYSAKEFSKIGKRSSVPAKAGAASPRRSTTCAVQADHGRPCAPVLCEGNAHASAPDGAGRRVSADAVAGGDEAPGRPYSSVLISTISPISRKRNGGDQAASSGG